MVYKHPTTVRDVGLSFFVGEALDEMGPVYNPQPSRIVLPEDNGDITVLLSQPYFGADDDLGRELLRHFLDNYSHCKAREHRLILIHQAVRLACVTAYPCFVEAVYGFLKRNGILLVCEFSARSLGVIDNIKVGRLAGVEEICRCLISSQKVIRI